MNARDVGGCDTERRISVLADQRRAGDARLVRANDVVIPFGADLGSERSLSSASVVVNAHTDGTFDVLVGPIMRWSGGLDMSQVLSTASGYGIALGQAHD
jgi:hypothetical protein